jgi:Na+-transporting NADH:ubiquinone oxidoreductase subunit NqrB
MVIVYCLLFIVGITASWIRIKGQDEIHKLAAIMAGSLAIFLLFMMTSAIIKLILSIWIIWFFKPGHIVEN